MTKEEILQKCATERFGTLFMEDKQIRYVLDEHGFINKAMDEYAKQEAIGFAQWIDLYGYTNVGEDRWESYNNMSGVTYNDLYQRYLQSKLNQP